MRADKWLCFARFFKTRSLSAKIIAEGKLRINGSKVSKPSVAVAVGDTLTFTAGERVRVIEVLAMAERRGPASEAQSLYVDHSPAPPEKTPFVKNPSFEGKGRPSAKDRRAIVAFRKNRLD